MFATYVQNMDPVALPLFGKLALRWYGLAYLGGFVAGFFLLKYLARKGLWVLKEDKVGDFIAATALLGVFLGGRLGYVFFYQLPREGFASLLHDPLMIFRVWEGGMASHGGIIGVAVFLWFYARKHKVTWTGLGDGISVVAPVGLFFGRIANFINGELYGRVAHGVAWAMKFPMSLVEEPVAVQEAVWSKSSLIDPRLAHAEGLETLAAAARENPEIKAVLAEYLPARHPSQLYEAALEGVLLFAIMWTVRLRWKNAPDGFLTGLFFLLYAVFRIVVEQFREPDAALVGPLTKGQFFSLFMVLFAAGFFAHAWRGWKSRAEVRQK